ncbi:hypothetical protein [Sphaerisporangium sp. TRM90804]|uniref:hypothetical protein n=1 Tax=Sphaerisporangium sp. TRM90804 TaxID=3031113 RepID=UPI0024482A4F|nr:hypothetical protein [Sphaerisporangium sp. TRM90804]MDH2429309.1 hypothetical protein [Sphaerisporangium sp. TRM90804]
MPIKDFTDGERPPASDLNRYPLQQVHIIKTADETYNSTVMQDDNHLFLDVVAGTEYWVQAFLIYEADEREDFKIGFVGPSGSTFDWMSDSLISSGVTSSGPVSRSLQAFGNTPSPGGVGQGTFTRCVAMPRGVLRVGLTSGVFRLQWAKLSGSFGIATTVYAGSLIRVRRLTT